MRGRGRLSVSVGDLNDNEFMDGAGGGVSGIKSRAVSKFTSSYIGMSEFASSSRGMLNCKSR